MASPHFQFRLKTLLAVLAVFLVWLGFHSDRRHRQMRAVDAIVALGGQVSYPGEAGDPGGLAQWFGKDFVSDVSAVFLGGRPIDDTDLDCLADLPALETLNLASTPLTDAGLDRLVGLKQLKHVDVRFTQVTEQGVNRLRAALPHAKIYRLSDIE